MDVLRKSHLQFTAHRYSYTWEVLGLSICLGDNEVFTPFSNIWPGRSSGFLHRRTRAIAFHTILSAHGCTEASITQDTRGRCVRTGSRPERRRIRKRTDGSVWKVITSKFLQMLNSHVGELCIHDMSQTMWALWTLPDDICSTLFVSW